jgi:hypothetical protein
LSPIILEHCRLLLVDSFVRDLFACAVNISLVDTERVLSEKNDKDLKLEREMTEVGSSSAADLAAKEARVDRTRSFWQSSKWARKLLGSGVVSMSQRRILCSISPSNSYLLPTFAAAVQDARRRKERGIDCRERAGPANEYLVNVSKTGPRRWHT